MPAEDLVDVGTRDRSLGHPSTPSGDPHTAGSSSNNSNPHGVTGVASALSNFYAHQFPTPEELEYSIASEMASVDDLREVVAELRRQVDVLKEETKFMSSHADTLRHHRSGGGGGNHDQGSPTFLEDGDNAAGRDDPQFAAGAMPNMDDSLNSENSDRAPPSTSMELGSARGSRRGPSSGFRGGAGDHGGAQVSYVLIEDKMLLLSKESDRLRQKEDKAFRESEEIRDLLLATVEEASRRRKELRLEIIKFNREVMDEETGTASANLLRLYMERRAAAQKSYLDKLLGQCQAAEEDIARAQQQLRTRRAAGEAFHAIDFEQLRIENQQFNERIDKKNQELVELKGTSTRTVQSLNMLMDAMNEMTNDQIQLKKEYKSRCDYLSRCEKEVVVVSQEAGKAEGKHHALRAQHEAVKVPKIEEYIAQKAELFELEKACKNWKRKVEIAEGQRQVLRQQLQRLRKQRDAAIEYSQNKKKRLQENLGKCPTKLPSISLPSAPKPPPGVALPQGFAPIEEDGAPSHAGRGRGRKNSRVPKAAVKPSSKPATPGAPDQEAVTSPQQGGTPLAAAPEEKG